MRTTPPVPLPESGQLWSAWTRLGTSTSQADPFCCTPAWHMPFHEVFSPHRRLLMEAASDSLIAFAEKKFSSGAVFLTPVEAHWFFGCPLLGKHAVALLADALDRFAARAPVFPRLVVSGIRPGGTLARRLAQTFGSGFDFFLHARSVQCAASLHNGLEGFLSRRSPNHRSKLHKAARRALREGMSFERVTPASPAQAEATYRRMLAVEAASWKGAGRCGMAEPPAKEFYEAMLRRLAALGKARVIFARHGDKDIGFIFGGMAGKVYRGQQFSYDAAWRQWSVGNLMQLEKIAWLCEEGARRYDMGPLSGPRMAYKGHWTEKTMEMQTWVLQKH